VDSAITAIEIQTPTRSSQLDSLPGLRFFAAFFILFSHACEWVAPFKDTDVLPRYGSIPSLYGMPLFFVLSGFVIHYNYGTSFATTRFRWAVWAFFGARFARLYPLLVICFCVGLIVDFTFNWWLCRPWWWVQLVAAFLTMTQSWFYVVIFDDRMLMENAFGLAWSISTEFFFYLAYMGLVFLILQLRTLRRTVIAWIIFAFSVLVLFVEAKNSLGWHQRSSKTTYS
jgi:peptidoglycan/LPS O-acetylase OafA/YrhL